MINLELLVVALKFGEPEAVGSERKSYPLIEPVTMMPSIGVVAGTALKSIPRLIIPGLTLDIGPYRSPEEHERHVLATIGSGNRHPSEYDEFRFDKTTGLLSSLRLHIPKRNAQADEWSTAPAPQGTIRLKELVSFNVNRA